MLGVTLIIYRRLLIRYSSITSPPSRRIVTSGLRRHIPSRWRRGRRHVWKRLIRLTRGGDCKKQKESTGHNCRQGTNWHMLVYGTMYRACGNPVHFSFIMIHPENQSCLSPEREKPCIVLVDGTYHLFRAYHALPPLHNQAGEPTGALHGAIKIITKLRWYKPEKLVRGL